MMARDEEKEKRSVVPKKTTKAKKKTTRKKPAAKKSGKTEEKTAKKKKTARAKSATKKPAATKSATKKATARKPAAKKPATRKSATKKATARKPAAKKPATRKSAAKKPSSGKPAGKAGTKAKAARPSAPPISAPDRRGQLEVERSRFELGEYAPVLREELGELPPGYGLTVVRGLIRDPRHLVLTWDINDPQQVRRLDELGWDRVEIRIDDLSGTDLVRVAVGRRAGTHHLELPRPGLSVEIAMGIVHPDGFFETIARSAPVRLPPEAPEPAAETVELATIPADVDPRTLVAAEPPPKPGYPARRSGSPGRRLAGRLGRAPRTERSGGGAGVRFVPAGASSESGREPATGAREGAAGRAGREGSEARERSISGAPSSGSLARRPGQAPSSPGRHDFGSSRD